MLYKVCSICKVSKAHKEYQARPERKIGIKPACKKCDSNKSKKRYYEDKDNGLLKDKLWKREGINITSVIYEAKYNALNGCCEICNKQFAVLCVDHKHTTSELRGLLCTGCNLAIANFKDSKENMMRAIQYIEKYGADYE